MPALSAATRIVSDVTAPPERISGLAKMIRTEYDDMPGHCLSRAQIQRMWFLEAADCEDVLRTLVDAGYLRQARNGYVRG